MLLALRLPCALHCCSRRPSQRITEDDDLAPRGVASAERCLSAKEVLRLPLVQRDPYGFPRTSSTATTSCSSSQPQTTSEANELRCSTSSASSSASLFQPPATSVPLPRRLVRERRRASRSSAASWDLASLLSQAGSPCGRPELLTELEAALERLSSQEADGQATIAELVRLLSIVPRRPVVVLTSGALLLLHKPAEAFGSSSPLRGSPLRGSPLAGSPLRRAPGSPYFDLVELRKNAKEATLDLRHASEVPVPDSDEDNVFETCGSNVFETCASLSTEQVDNRQVKRRGRRRVNRRGCNARGQKSIGSKDCAPRHSVLNYESSDPSRLLSASSCPSACGGLSDTHYFSMMTDMDSSVDSDDGRELEEMFNFTLPHSQLARTTFL